MGPVFSRTGSFFAPENNGGAIIIVSNILKGRGKENG
jgi:hypothetical protein